MQDTGFLLQQHWSIILPFFYMFTSKNVWFAIESRMKPDKNVIPTLKLVTKVERNPMRKSESQPFIQYQWCNQRHKKELSASASVKAQCPVQLRAHCRARIEDNAAKCAIKVQCTFIRARILDAILRTKAGWNIVCFLCYFSCSSVHNIIHAIAWAVFFFFTAEFLLILWWLISSFVMRTFHSRISCYELT